MIDSFEKWLEIEYDRFSLLKAGCTDGSDDWWKYHDEQMKILKLMQPLCESEFRCRFEKIQKDLELEAAKKKDDISWKKVAFEMGKIVVPLAISIVHYNVAANKMYDFETHGRITSTAGRELKLPKIFMK